MFEKDTRKITREKRQGELSSPTSPRKFQKEGEDIGDKSNTVYGELKLSEKLSLEMIQVRKEKESLKERIEQVEILYQNLEKKLVITEVKYNKNKYKLKLSKSFISSLEK